MVYLVSRFRLYFQQKVLAIGICAPNSAKPLAAESGAHGSRLGRSGDDIAGQAKLAFAEEEHGLVLAGLRFARRQQGPVVYVCLGC